jgi:hypothetical protein
MIRIELLNDGWAELNEPEEITNGERKRAVVAYDAGIGLAKDFAAWDVLLGAMVIGWSHNLPLPRDDRDSLDVIPMDDANRLYGHLRGVISRLFPSFAPVPDPDPKVLTTSSSGSNGQ